jgi:hypothetical protein
VGEGEVRCRKMNIYSVYGLGSEKTDEVKGNFSNNMSGCGASFGGQCNVVVLGDLIKRVAITL